MNFDNKKIYVAPYTARSTMFAKEFLHKNPTVQMLGYIDKYREGEDISRLEQIVSKEFDLILIMSQNHFGAIYDEYKVVIPKRKLIKVDIVQGTYEFFSTKDIYLQKLKEYPQKVRLKFAKKYAAFVDKKNIKREKIVFINKSFVSANNKALFCESLRNGLDAVMLTDNKMQIQQMRNAGIPCEKMGTIKSIMTLIQGKLVVLDQGNSNAYLKYMSPQQKTLQIWHGIPLKRLNRLDEVEYDFYAGPSTFVNDTSLGEVIPHKESFAYGYARNDVLVKEKLDDKDRLLCNEELLELAMNNRAIIYVPTHREATASKDKLVPLDFDAFNAFLKSIDTYFIIKFHPFVLQFYGKLQTKNYSHIKFADMQSDIYPVMKYCDLLITDYSSIYFDYLVTCKPIMFFNYDYEEYSSNMSGLLYSYEEVTPGLKVETQEELQEALHQLFIDKKDDFYEERIKIRNQFFDYYDDQSAQRIVDNIIKKS